MPNTKSAYKRLKQDRKKHLRNKSAKSALKTKIKQFRELVKSKKPEKAKEIMKEIEKMLDKAECKGILHRNKARRTKSRLMKKLP